MNTSERSIPGWELSRCCANAPSSAPAGEPLQRGVPQAGPGAERTSTARQGVTPHGRPLSALLFAVSVVVASVRAAEPSITLHTDFETGSAGKVEPLGETELRVHVAGQANEIGRNRQANWYYFRLSGVRDRAVTVRLTDFVGEYNLRPGACAMTADTVPFFSEDNERWTHFPAMDWDDQRKEATLHFQTHADSVWIAHTPPYPLARVHKLLADVKARPGVRIDVLGQSVRGRDLHLVTVTSPGPTADRKRVWIIARQHGWETGTSYVLEGALRFLVSDDPQARACRDRFVVCLVPTMDPDGLVEGHVRFNALGYDLNRHWPEVDPSREDVRAKMPEIWCVKKALFASLDRGEHIDFLLNLHNTETADYMETQARDDLVQSRLRRLHEGLLERSTYDPDRAPTLAKSPSDTTTSLWTERGIPAVLLEQRIASSPKLGERPSAADRLVFGRQLVIELARAIDHE